MFIFMYCTVHVMLVGYIFRVYIRLHVAYKLYKLTNMAKISKSGYKCIVVGFVVVRLLRLRRIAHWHKCQF